MGEVVEEGGWMAGLGRGPDCGASIWECDKWECG